VQRHQDWLRQAEADLAAAHTLQQAGHWAWCCFTCQQVAEKALKAIGEQRRLLQRGHDLVALGGLLGLSAELTKVCMRLDRHYIPTRYPDAFAQGAPSDHFSDDDAKGALEDAAAVLAFAREALGPS
jgi:HEPN domain-containing protein